MDKPIISKIEIKLGEGVTASLTVEQARELKEALDELLGAKERVVVERIIEQRPWQWWECQPYVAPLGTWSGDGTTATIAFSASGD